MRQLRKPIPSFIQLKIITLRYIVLGVMLSRSPFYSQIPSHSKHTQTNARPFIPQFPSPETLSNLCSPLHSPIPLTRDTFKTMLFPSFPNPLHPRHFQNYALSLPSQTNAQPRAPTPNAESDCAHGNAMGQSLSAGGVGGTGPPTKKKLTHCVEGGFGDCLCEFFEFADG